jgi:hypothetical protein
MSALCVTETTQYVKRERVSHGVNPTRYVIR